VLSRDGRVLTAKEVRIVPGPGAGMLTKARFNREQSNESAAPGTAAMPADESDSATD
jgi:hypothetical protein